MNAKITGGVSYITIIGWIVAIVLGDKNDSLAKHHLNQSLVINIIGLLAAAVGWLLGLIPVIRVLAGIVGGVLGVVFLLLAIYGAVFAFKGEAKTIPFVGEIKIIK